MRSIDHLLENQMHNHGGEQKAPTFFRMLGIALVIANLTGLAKSLIFG